MAHLSKHNDALLARVRRIAGQMSAIERALTTGDDCTTTLHLVAGARGAINGLMAEIIQEHVREHVVHPDLTDADRQTGADELMEAIRRYSK
jgi:DNA-binding FrmR family transcriptional regulator